MVKDGLGEIDEWQWVGDAHLLRGSKVRRGVTIVLCVTLLGETWPCCSQRQRRIAASSIPSLDSFI